MPISCEKKNANVFPVAGSKWRFTTARYARTAAGRGFVPGATYTARLCSDREYVEVRRPGDYYVLLLADFRRLFRKVQ